MKHETLKFFFLNSFFSVLNTRNQFSCKKKAKEVFMDDKQKKYGKWVYTSFFLFLNIFPWRKTGYSWKIEFFFKKKKRNFFCCFFRRNFLIPPPRINLNSGYSLLNLFFSLPFLKIGPRYFPFFKWLNFLVNSKPLWIKAPINKLGKFGSFLNYLKDSFICQKKSKKVEEEFYLTSNKFNKRTFLILNEEFLFVNWFERHLVNKFLLRKYFFFSKLFGFYFNKIQNYKKISNF